MNETSLITKLLFLYPEQEIENRISVIWTSDEANHYVVELHSLKCKEANRLVNNILALSKEPCEIELIHGLNQEILG